VDEVAEKKVEKIKIFDGAKVSEKRLCVGMD
jgi:hypothetical protein